MHGLNGPDRSLSKYFSKPLIINVWASWCGPCRAEINSLERLSWSAALSDVNIIGISTDDHPDRARAFLDRNNTTIRHYIDQQLVAERMLGGERLPLTLLIDAQGRVLRKIVGAQEWDSQPLIEFLQAELLTG